MDHRWGEPEIVFDGVDDLATLGDHLSSRPCPVCGADCGFDAAAVVRTGISVGWATGPDVDQLQLRLLASFPFAVGELDGHRTLRDAHGCAPHVALARCGGCGTDLLAVVSYGEVQPARWRMVVLGLTLAPTS